MMLCSYINILVFMFMTTTHGEDTFTSLVYKQYGFLSTDSQQLLLSQDNLTSLSQTILSGQTYNLQAQLCSDSTCSNTSCYSPIAERNGSSLSISDFTEACPRILYSLTQDCIKSSSDEEHSTAEPGSKPPAIKVWGYGFLFVTLINLCSLAGIFVLPLMKKDFYSNLLMFLIALAVGSLAANGILVLIPEAFEIVHIEGYTWKACTIIGGIYLFFITERVLKMITEYYANRRNERNGPASSDVVGSVPTETYIDINREAAKTHHADYKLDQLEQSSDALLIQNKMDSGDVNTGSNGQACNGNGHTPAKVVIKEPKKPIATVAWMIIFGDAFHNFIDGLSIGAAFSESILLGVSICIAVLCEELPHELGDFAILLNAGVSKKKALLFNFLSACTCYLGLIIGITLSNVAHATPWILGVAGGMFLYISLADMMPEMNHAAEEHKDQPFKVFFLQNLGFLCGFGVILLVSHFGGQIQL